MYKKIGEYEAQTKEYNNISDKLDADLRDVGKKVQKFETKMEETLEKLQTSSAKMEEAEKEYKDKEEDVNAQARRVLLLEEEVRISIEKLATTILKLANMSKDADKIVKTAREWESKTLNNEVEIEQLDVQMREAKRIGHDNEMKYDNLARSLSMMEDELAAIGENQKQLEVSEEKARKREEKYQDQIKQLNLRLKQADSRSEYAEMNISKLHLRIDELEDEIIREKLKINAVSGQLDDTFNEMLNKY